MNKAELVAVLAEKLGYSRAETERFIDALTDQVTERLKTGEKVTIVGFGTFDVTQRAARVGRNPKTRETIQIAATRTAKFKPGTALKDALK